MKRMRLWRGGVERPWLCEELIQHVAAMPEPLPPWAKKSPCLKVRSICCFFNLLSMFLLVFWHVLDIF